MKAIVCDRCGKVEKAAQGGVDFSSYYALQYTIMNPPKLKQYELCMECAKEFEKWVKNK